MKYGWVGAQCVHGTQCGWVGRGATHGVHPSVQGVGVRAQNPGFKLKAMHALSGSMVESRGAFKLGSSLHAAPPRVALGGASV